MMIFECAHCSRRLRINSPTADLARLQAVVAGWRFGHYTLCPVHALKRPAE